MAEGGQVGAAGTGGQRPAERPHSPGYRRATTTPWDPAQPQEFLGLRNLALKKVHKKKSHGKYEISG